MFQINAITPADPHRRWRSGFLRGLGLTAAVGGLLATSGPVRADVIFLFNGPHTATFAALGGGGLEVSTSGVSEDTLFGDDFSTAGFKLGPANFAASPMSGSTWSVAATEGFTYISDGDALSGVVSWASLEVGPEAASRLTAELTGVLAVGPSVGDSAFLGDFPAGSTAEIVAYFLPPCPIDALAAGGCGTTSEVGSFDGGAVLPTDPSPLASGVPEPSALSLLLVALSTLALSAGRASFSARRTPSPASRVDRHEQTSSGCGTGARERPSRSPSRRS